MKTISSILFCFLIFISCRQKTGDEIIRDAIVKSLPSKLTINSKTIAFDTVYSKGLKKCDIIPAEINTLASCIISKGTKKYIRLYTLIMNKDQYANQLYQYYPMGPVITSGNELSSHKALFDAYHLALKNDIRLDDDQRNIIDNNDTLPVADHWPKEKLIFVSSAPAFLQGRSAIYGYE